MGAVAQIGVNIIAKYGGTFTHKRKNFIGVSGWDPKFQSL